MKIQQKILSLLIKKEDSEKETYLNKIRADLLGKQLLKNLGESRSNDDNINIHSMELLQRFDVKLGRVIDLLLIRFTDDDSVRMKGIFHKLTRDTLVDNNDNVYII